MMINNATSDLTNLIDNHFHLKVAEAADDQEAEAPLKEAVERGLFAAIEAGTSSKDGFEERRFFAERYPNIYLTAGCHPAAIEEHAADLTVIREECGYEKTIAVGEIGLDYSYDISKKAQQELFAAQLSLARELELPVMLHIRDAHDDALAIMKEQQITHGVVHCFTGDQVIAKRWLDQNFYLSFSGIVTFKNAKDIAQSAAYAPADKIFCETDAPFLAPVPYRGQKNKISYVREVYQFVAQLRQTELPLLAEQIKTNFKNLYHV